MKNDITPQIKSDLKQLRAEVDEFIERWKNEDGFNIEVLDLNCIDRFS